MRCFFPFFSFLFFVINNHVYSQEIENGDWELYEMNINSISSILPVNAYNEPVVSNFDGNTSQTWICDTVSLYFQLYSENSTFLVTSGGVTLGGCDVNKEITWESVQSTEYKFVTFFVHDKLYEYVISKDNEQYQELTITADNGDYIIYRKNILSNNSNIIKQSAFLIYPNPVDEKLYIKTPKYKGNIDVKIFDISGKLIQINLSVSSLIDVSDLKKGDILLK